MAEKKISELDAAAALTGAELVPVVQDSVTVQTNLGDIAGLNAAAIAAAQATADAAPTAFIELSDVPVSFEGQQGNYVRVKDDATGLEFNSDVIALSNVYTTQGAYVAANSGLALSKLFTTLDATNGDMFVLLPFAQISEDPPLDASSMTRTVKRVDSSLNSASIRPQSGEKLEGLVDGEIFISPLESATFKSNGTDTWWRV